MTFSKWPPTQWIPRFALAALLLGCDHADPFDGSVTDLGGPMQPGIPVRLTLNPLDDLNPSWLPDGSALLYSFEANAVRNFDQCLALLPPEGGTRRELCSTSAGHLDSTEVYGPAAVSDSGRLVYVFTQATPGRQIPNRQELRVATLSDPQTFQVLHPLPFTIDGFKIDAVANVFWLGETRIVYAGAYGIPNTTTDDTVIVLIDLATSSVTVIPGTTGTASVAHGADPDVIAFTTRGDSRVHGVALTTGALSVLHDFAPLSFPGDIAVEGDRLIAVLGSGLVDVDLMTGLQQPLTGPDAPPFIRLPALSVSGAVVVEGGASRQGPMDLWLYRAPPS